MVSQNELNRRIRYVRNHVECVERNNYNYGVEELKDELEGLEVVKKNINEFINQNQDLSVDQLSVLKAAKHLLYDCIEKLKAQNNPNRPRQNPNRNGRPAVNANRQGQRNGPNHQEPPALPFGGADYPTMIRFLRNQIDNDIGNSSPANLPNLPKIDEL